MAVARGVVERERRFWVWPSGARNMFRPSAIGGSGAVTAYGCVAWGGSSARVRMYVGHDVGTSFSHCTLSLVTQSIARTVEVSELPAAARVVVAVGVII